MDSNKKKRLSGAFFMGNLLMLLTNWNGKLACPNASIA
jgi:hypothetical protein